MDIYSDETLAFFGDVYMSLDSRYALSSCELFDFESFLERPSFNEYWVHLYFANPRLFTPVNELGIRLIEFLQNPAQIMKRLVHQDISTPVDLNSFLPLLRKQSMAVAAREKMDKYRDDQEFYEKKLNKRKCTMEAHDGTLKELFHHYAPCKKRKTGRGLKHA